MRAMTSSDTRDERRRAQAYTYLERKGSLALALGFSGGALLLTDADLTWPLAAAAAADVAPLAGLGVLPSPLGSELHAVSKRKNNCCYFDSGAVSGTGT